MKAYLGEQLYGQTLEGLEGYVEKGEKKESSSSARQFQPLQTLFFFALFEEARRVVLGLFAS